MFGIGKTKPAAKDSAGDIFKTALDGCIAAALAAGCKPAGLADLIESRLSALQTRAALSWSPNIVPRAYDGHGKLIT